MRYNGDGPVFGIDIDGTLGDYHTWFIKFAEMYTGRQLPNPTDINPALPLHRFLGLSKSTYRKIKLAYRQGGMKRGMPVYPGAALLCSALRSSGAEVWICTSRPFNQLGNVDDDTRHWLRRHGIQHDNVLWGEHKYRDLRRRAGGRVVAILDDLPEMIEQATDLGLAAIIRTQPYNLHVPVEASPTRPADAAYGRVGSSEEARSLLEKELALWKESNLARPSSKR